MRAAAVVALLLAAMAAAAQTAGGEAPTPPTAAAPAAAAPAESAEPEVIDPSLPDPARQRDSLLRDIAGASYYELLAWCRELGLDDTGDVQALQARLREHYAVAPEPAVEPRPVRVEIVSARETDYFTVDAVQEDYVILRGGVVVKVTDDGGSSLHTISADELIYNQTTSTMTARGGARYVLSRDGKEEVFEGESLSFDTESLSGVFYRGTVIRERSVSGRALTFTFRGESISRLENDTVLLEDATITSSKPVDPYYSLEARKAWILGEGEWALLGATLKVGRIPVFYLPFFFLPGDEIIFHPSVEARSREGTAIQTTTYLVGQRKRTADSLSLLRLSEEEPGPGYRREARGLFLTVDPDSRVPLENPDRYVTLMADVYSRLGGMVGVEAKIPPQYSGRLGIGLSRSIFRDGSSGAYTPYWRDPTEGYVSIWNRSSVAGLELPIRFGIESSVELKPSVFTITGSIEYYSDPFFPSDFYNRSQGIQWDQVLSGTAASTASTAQKTSLTWTAKTAFNAGPLLKTSLVSELALRSLDLAGFFSSRSVDTTGDPVGAADPARSFYYPVRLKLPGVSLGIRGTLLTLPAQRAPSAAPTPEEAEARKPGDVVKGAGIVVPGDASPEPPRGEAAESGETDALRIAEAKGDIAVAVPGEGTTLEVTYGVSPVLAVEHLFAESEWLAPEDVDLDTTAHTLGLQADASLRAELGLFGKVVSLASELTGAASYKTRSPGSEPPTDALWATQRLADYTATKLGVGEKTTVTLRPFAGIGLLETTSLAYTFGWQFLGIGLREGTVAGEDPVFETRTTLDADSVTAHTLVATLGVRPAKDAQTLTLTAVLPPEDISLKAQLTLLFLNLTTRLAGSVKVVEEAWVPDPVTLGLSFQPLTWLTLSQDAQLGVATDPPQLARLVSTVKLAGFTGTFTALWMAPVDPLGVAAGEPEAFLPATIQLQYVLPSGVDYFWRDRIRFERQATLAWSWNLQRFTQNELTLNVKLSLTVYRFLTLTFSAKSYNNRMYRYIPVYAEELGIDWVNPLYDLARSFNFFRVEDRYLSAFKVRELAFTVAHQMNDWDLKVEYSGKPALKTLEDGTRRYEWDRTVSLLLEWKPLALVRAKATGDSTGFRLRE